MTNEINKEVYNFIYNILPQKNLEDRKLFEVIGEAIARYFNDPEILEEFIERYK